MRRAAGITGIGIFGTLCQQRRSSHFQAAPPGKLLRSIARAHQVAAVNGMEFVMCSAESHRQRLLVAGIVQRDVELALDALADIPVGLAMADETDARTCMHE